MSSGNGQSALARNSSTMDNGAAQANCSFLVLCERVMCAQVENLHEAQKAEFYIYICVEFLLKVKVELNCEFHKKSLIELLVLKESNFIICWIH